jgi:uncharacterized protein (DUF2336 family)
LVIMIVRHFLRWIQTAAPGDRAEATSALARAYLYSELSDDDRLAAGAAMIVLLDDPSPLVRRALADALASSEYAPHGVILALAGDQTDIAEIVVSRSPVLLEAELVDMISPSAEKIQCAIASRTPLSCSVAAAIAEVGSAAACLVLIENSEAEFTPDLLARIIERHGHLAAVRESLLGYEDLTVEIRQALVAKLSDTLARFVTHREWLPEAHAQHITRDACDRVTVAMAAETDSSEVAPLVHHLVVSGQLTGGLILRALLAGNIQFIVEAFAQLSGIDARRVASIVADSSAHGFRALYEKVGLPNAAFRAFQAALEVIYESGLAGDLLGYAILRRRIVERVLKRYEEAADGELDHLLALLRKLAAESARDEARLYTADLLAAA